MGRRIKASLMGQICNQLVPSCRPGLCSVSAKVLFPGTRLSHPRPCPSLALCSPVQGGPQGHAARAASGVGREGGPFLRVWSETGGEEGAHEAVCVYLLESPSE